MLLEGEWRSKRSCKSHLFYLPFHMGLREERCCEHVKLMDCVSIVAVVVVSLCRATTSV